jgi:hypothetical protein
MNSDSNVAEYLARALAEHSDVVSRTAENVRETFQRLVIVCLESIRHGHKLLFFGNGGSAADAQHFATELVVRYKANRPAISVLARTIERQLAALRPDDGTRVLLSSPWAHVHYQTSQARFVRNSLWEDLSPVEWLLRKLGAHLHMQNASWLVSRELAEAAGGWDEALNYDQDGEYFSRVLSMSK